MTEENKAVMLDSAGQARKPETLIDYMTKPDAPDIESGGASGKSAGKEDATPVVPDPNPPSRDATRFGGTKQIVYIDHADLYPFKGHPFEV